MWQYTSFSQCLGRHYYSTSYKGMKGKEENFAQVTGLELNPALHKDNILLEVIHDFTEVKTVLSPNFLMVK